MKKYLIFLKTRFFLTKVLPALFFVIPSLIELHKAIFGLYDPTALEFIAIAIAAVLLLNLFMRQYWISCIIGTICAFCFFILIFAVISEYSEFPNPMAFDALRLLSIGFLLCLSGITAGIMLMIPFKSTIE
jgi:hypothetical protein